MLTLPRSVKKWLKEEFGTLTWYGTSTDKDSRDIIFNFFSPDGTSSVDVAVIRSFGFNKRREERKKFVYIAKVNESDVTPSIWKYHHSFCSGKIQSRYFNDKRGSWYILRDEIINRYSEQFKNVFNRELSEFLTEKGFNLDSFCMWLNIPNGEHQIDYCRQIYGQKGVKIIGDFIHYDFAYVLIGR